MTTRAEARARMSRGVELYRTGLSIYDVAERFGVTGPCVWRWINLIEPKLMRPGGWPREPQVGPRQRILLDGLDCIGPSQLKPLTKAQLMAGNAQAGAAVR